MADIKAAGPGQRDADVFHKTTGKEFKPDREKTGEEVFIDALQVALMLFALREEIIAALCELDSFCNQAHLHRKERSLVVLN